MKNIKMAAAAALLSLCFALPANAATFDFFWSGDPTLDASIVSSDDPGATAIGTLDINVANGAAFTPADISNFDVKVKVDPIGEFQFNFAVMFGTVSNDGSSVSVTEFEAYTRDLDFMCCLWPTDLVFIDTSFRTPEGAVFVRYTDVAAALASLKLTAAPAVDPVPPVDDPVPPAVIPVPAALPLLGTGLAVFGLMGWRRKQAVNKAA